MNPLNEPQTRLTVPFRRLGQLLKVGLVAGGLSCGGAGALGIAIHKHGVEQGKALQLSEDLEKRRALEACEAELIRSTTRDAIEAATCTDEFQESMENEQN